MRQIWIFLFHVRCAGDSYLPHWSNIFGRKSCSKDKEFCMGDPECYEGVLPAFVYDKSCIKQILYR